jgi:hypothetical protein
VVKQILQEQISALAVVRGEYLFIKIYKQVGGLGSPASLQAYFNGPSGNNLCK